MTLSSALRQRVVVTADDYGIRETAEPILRLAREGSVDRVAVMAHFVTHEAAQALLQTGVKIDIHLELIDLMGRGEELESGVFGRSLAFLRAFILGRLRPRVVEAYWKKQVERFTGLFGRLPDGFNSHEHVHFFPFLFPAFVRLATQYKVKVIRFGTRGILWRASCSPIGGILAFLRICNLPRARRGYLESSQWLIGLDWLTEHESFLESLPPEGTVEVVVHPERPAEYAFVADTFQRV